MSTPWSTLGLISLYIATVTISPRVMKNREAFNLKWLLLVYNFVLVILSLYMLCEVRVVFIINTTMLGTSIGSYILRRSWQNYTLRILVPANVILHRKSNISPSKFRLLNHLSLVSHAINCVTDLIFFRVKRIVN